MDNLSPIQRSENMRRIKSAHTKPEKLVRSILHRAGLRYRLHVRSLPGAPDIVFPARKTAVFVNGCFWHGHKCNDGHHPKSNTAYWDRKLSRNRERDVMTRTALKNIGWKQIVVWSCETSDTTLLTRRLLKLLTK